MNIGILIPGFSDGEQDWCIPVYLNLVRTLAQFDSVRVFALRYPPRRDSYPIYGAQVYALGGRSSMAGIARWILLARTVAAIVRQHRARPFDILHAIWADETGFAASIAGKLIGVPVVVSIAGGELVALPGYGLKAGRVSGWLVAQTLAQADCVTAPCTYAASLISATTPRPERLEIVALGVDTELFTPSNLPRDDNRLLCVGSLTDVKGHDRAIRALAELPGVYLDLGGDGPALERLRSLAKSLGVEGRVTFHGAVRHEALPAFYQAATLLVLPSRHEAFGMVVTEAAACGLPTVGFALGVLNDFSGSARAGVAVPQGDIPALANAIRALLSDPDRRAQFGDAARRMVESRYTVTHMCQHFQAIYRTLAANV